MADPTSAGSESPAPPPIGTGAAAAPSHPGVPPGPGSAPPFSASPASGPSSPGPIVTSGSRLDRLIRAPDSLLAGLDGPGAPGLLALLAFLALAGHLAYGLVVGSFSGGAQWWAAPVKIVLGAALCGAACFPSLYIFACLTGAEVGARHVVGIVLGLLALTAVFLAGFAPVAWVFSQSSTAVSFVGAIHVLVWTISIFASARVLFASLRRWKARRPELATTWLLILILTSLQMMTTLRPIVGTAEAFLDPGKRFFLQHWFRTLEQDARAP